jgi:hypothetical protein
MLTMIPNVMQQHRHGFRLLLIIILSMELMYVLSAGSSVQHPHEKYDDIGANLEPHPDPNEEHYEGMIYVGRRDHLGRRLGFDVDNGIKFIFGTGFDETHKEIEERDLHHEHYGPDAHHDVADRAVATKTREEVLRERRHNQVSNEGPKPFGHVGKCLILLGKNSEIGSLTQVSYSSVSRYS